MQPRQAPLCIAFSREEYWSGLLVPSPKSLLYATKTLLVLFIIFGSSFSCYSFPFTCRALFETEMPGEGSSVQLRIESSLHQHRNQTWGLSRVVSSTGPPPGKCPVPGIKFSLLLTTFLLNILSIVYKNKLRWPEIKCTNTCVFVCYIFFSSLCIYVHAPLE